MGAPRSKRQRQSRGLGPALQGLSRKSLRFLEEDGILDLLAAGKDLAVTDRVVRLGASGPFARLAFRVDSDRRLNVGYVLGTAADGPWTDVGGEFEPFTLRAYGYYVRYLKRASAID